MALLGLVLSCTALPTVEKDGVLSEKEFKKFFECFLRYAFFDVAKAPLRRVQWTTPCTDDVHS